MGKKRLIWLPLLCICLLSAPAAAKLMAVGYDNTDSPVVEIDEITGRFRVIGGSGFPYLNSLARDDAGRLLSVGGAAKNQLIAINPRTGRGTSLLTLDFGDDPVDVRGLAGYYMASRGEWGLSLWAINCRPGPGLQPRDLFEINLVTGVGTKLNDNPLGSIQSICHPHNMHLYLWCWDIDLGLGELNDITGEFTDSNPLIGGTPGIQGIAKRGAWWYGVGRLPGEHDKLYRIDLDGNYERLDTASRTYDLRGLEDAFDDIGESTGIGTCWSDTDSPVVGINPETGLVYTIGPSGFPHLNSLAKDFEGNLYAVGGAAKNQLIRIDRRTGAGTLMTILDFGDTPVDVRGLACTRVLSRYEFFATNCRPGAGLQPHDLFRIDMDHGEGTRVNPEGAPLPPTQSIAWSHLGGFYGWDVNNGLIMIDTGTGAFRDINPGISGPPGGIQSIAFAADGTLYGIGQVPGENTKLYLIDSLTGAYSLVGDADGNYNVRGLEMVPLIKPRISLGAIHLLLLHDLKEGPPLPVD
jgi:hypothetical protein